MDLNRKISTADAFIFKYYRVVHGIRISAAFVITLIATTYLDLPESTWILITLVVVIGPISYLGNVLPRAWHRTLGTLIGAVSGVLAIYLGQWSLGLMYLWCGIVMFLSAYFALGKRPYVGLLVGITLAVTIGASNHDIEVALWRGLDVTLGCALAVFFCFIYPQRAFIHWRMRLGAALNSFSTIYQLSSSPNVIEKPNIERYQTHLMKEMVTLRSLISPSVKESKLNAQLFEATQVYLRNMVYSFELLHTSYWSDRNSHLNMLWSKELSQCQKVIHSEIKSLSNLAITGELVSDFSGHDLQKLMNELKQSMPTIAGDEMSIHGYLWLNIKLMEDLVSLRRLIIYALNLSQE
ncbi:FUSC family protein [Vibrio methylphosphonaticus]|uniref:FUSC family protein n=1 Tax=Vibrio methylphosphonaticus TaxID=2946866 RepID=UPI002029F4C3|nr:FUSC family protein [Vibrio methylphosphonaticus]MCL9775132.1 FUSC family protein [Vibrio methylphosphonaticus]